MNDLGCGNLVAVKVHDIGRDDPDPMTEPPAHQGDVTCTGLHRRDRAPAIEEERGVITDSRAQLKHRLAIDRQVQRRQVLQSSLIVADIGIATKLEERSHDRQPMYKPR